MIRNIQSHSATLCPQILPNSVGTLFHADCCTEVTVLFIQPLFRESFGIFFLKVKPALAGSSKSFTVTTLRNFMKPKKTNEKCMNVISSLSLSHDRSCSAHINP